MWSKRAKNAKAKERKTFFLETRSLVSTNGHEQLHASNNKAQSSRGIARR